MHAGALKNKLSYDFDSKSLMMNKNAWKICKISLKQKSYDLFNSKWSAALLENNNKIASMDRAEAATAQRHITVRKYFANDKRECEPKTVNNL